MIIGSSEFKDIASRISKLKSERNAVILAHNYQRDEVQEVADYTGDSLELSRIAANTDFDVIVFAGVHFMAESASILSPDKTVLLTEAEAGCPMAEMVTVEGPRFYGKRFPGTQKEFCYTYPEEFNLRDIKAKYPGVPVVSYVNTTAAVKAESDICCTSANVVKVVESMDGDRVICVPDKNLAAWAARNTSKEIIAWDGFCNIHDRVSLEDVQTARAQHPGALLLAHPECPMEVLDEADFVTCTSGMLQVLQGIECEGIYNRHRAWADVPPQEGQPGEDVLSAQEGHALPEHEEDDHQERAADFRTYGLRREGPGRDTHPGETRAGQDAGN